MAKTRTTRTTRVKATAKQASVTKHGATPTRIKAHEDKTANPWFLETPRLRVTDMLFSLAFLRRRVTCKESMPQ